MSLDTVSWPGRISFKYVRYEPGGRRMAAFPNPKRMLALLKPHRNLVVLSQGQRQLLTIARLMVASRTMTPGRNV